jgi:hypothetical protein
MKVKPDLKPVRLGDRLDGDSNQIKNKVPQVFQGFLKRQWIVPLDCIYLSLDLPLDMIIIQ